MEIDIQIKNASLADLQQLFGKQNPLAIAPQEPAGGPRSLPMEDHREENLGRSTLLSDEIKPTKVPVKKKNKGNQNGPAWLPEETVVIKGCKDLPEAWSAYQKTFPGQRNRNAIDQKLRKLRKDAGIKVKPAIVPIVPQDQIKTLTITPQKRGGDQHTTKWTHAELNVLDGNLNNFDTAWAEYQKVIPDSKRNRNAVRQRWCIRINLQKNGRKIQKAAKNVRDPEPVMDDGPDDDHDIPLDDPAENSSEDLSRIDNPDPDIKTPPPDDWPDDDHDIIIGGSEGLVDKMPEIRPPTGEAHKRVHEVVAAAARQPIPDEFKVGVHVKQVKSYHDRKVSGIGIITARVHGLVEVNFSGAQYYKIAPDCLEVI